MACYPKTFEDYEEDRKYRENRAAEWASGAKILLELDAQFWRDQAAEMERVLREEGPEAAAALQAERDELNKPKYPMGTDYRRMCSSDIADECNRGIKSGRGVPEFMDCWARNGAPGLKLGLTKAGGKSGEKTIQEVVVYDNVISDY